jgi:RNA polymerase sigma factor (sigma-70 family)
LEFRDLREHELRLLSDDQLIDHVRAARRAGRADALKLGLAILVFGYMDNVIQRVRLKVPDSDVDDVAAIAVESAASAAFDGRSIGEFRSWLHTIVDRRIADYHRRRETRPKLDSLPTEHLDDEREWGEEPSTDFGEAVDAKRALRQTYDELSDEHRQVVDLYVLGPCSASEAAAQLPGMSEANVHQLASRFQKRFRELLGGGDTSDRR